MARKSNLMLIGVVLSVVLVACSSSATKTVETIPATTTTKVSICDPLQDCTNAQLQGAQLSGANLIGAQLTGAQLPGAQLSGANLIGANLIGANLFGAILSSAFLS